MAAGPDEVAEIIRQVLTVEVSQVEDEGAVS